MLDVFLDFLLGMVPDCLGGLFGIGGGLLAIPAPGVIFGLDQQLTQGTALATAAPDVVLTSWHHHQRSRIDPRRAGVLALTNLLCVFLASSVAARIDAAWMRETFVTFLLVLVGYMFQHPFRRLPQGDVTPRYGLPQMGVLGLGAGLLGGLSEVGDGALATPVLTSVFGLAQTVAQGLTLALATPSTTVAPETHAMYDHVDQWTGIPLALSDLLSISWGARLAHAASERSLCIAFCAFLALYAMLPPVRG